jgi:fucose permease
VFFLNGLLLSSYIVRIPSLKAAQHLDNGQLGLVGVLFGASALVTMQFVGALVARVSTVRVIRVGLLLMPVVLFVTGLRQGTAVFLPAVVSLGAVHGTLDVAMNTQAVAVERLVGRPILSGCHAAWSVSAVIASGLGAGMVAWDVRPAPHFALVGLLVIAGATLAGPRLLAADGVTPSSDKGSGPAGWRTGWSRTVIGLGLTGFALMLGEGAALGWSAVFLHDSRGASLALAAMGVTAYTASQTIGRLVGDRLKARYGARRMFRLGASVAVAGFTVAVLSPRPDVAVAGFSLFGLAGSSLIPMTFSAVGHAGGDGPRAAVFVSRFTTFTYGGIVLGPAIVGGSAQLVGLTGALAGLIPVLAAVAVASRLPES